jgi:TonB-dependent starch-binding outer membrane protein SusC
MQQQHIVSNLRLRAGYGIAGNQNIPNYGYLTMYHPSISLGSNILTNDGNYGNPDLRWEKQKQFNLGMNAGFYNDRVNITIDWFHIVNEDLLMKRSTTPSSGYTSKLDNVGSLENKGIEFMIDVNAIDREELHWNLSFNLSADKNKITKLYDDVTEIYNLGGYSNNEIQREGNLFVGKPINNIYVYKFDRIVQESDMEYVNTLELGSRIVKPGDILPLDRDKNGIINDDDRFVVGKRDPDFYGGFSSNLNYKGLEFNIRATYSVGGHRISYLYESLMSSLGASAAHRDLLNRWTPANTNTNIPRAYSDGGRFSLSEVDWAVQNSSFLRLSEITLAYSLPQTILKTIRMENIRFYVTGNNMLTLTRYKGYDPESGDWYPSYRMFVVGANVSF